MAQSRLERIGTIFSRVTNLIRTGAVNMNDRPVWYDVYKAFPPRVPPKYVRNTPDIPIMQIFYNEDIIRARFQQEMGRNLPAFNLKDAQYKTLTQRMIDVCKTIQQEKNLEFEEAYQEALNLIKRELPVKSTQPSTQQTSDLASTFKAALEDRSQTEEAVKLDVKNIFQEK